MIFWAWCGCQDVRIYSWDMDIMELTRFQNILYCTQQHRPHLQDHNHDNFSESKFITQILKRLSCQLSTNTRHCPDVDLMLGQRRRRWASVKTTLGQYLAFAWLSLTFWEWLIIDIRVIDERLNLRRSCDFAGNYLGRHLNRWVLICLLCHAGLAGDLTRDQQPDILPRQ